MTKQISVAGRKVSRRGKRMTKGSRYRIVTVSGRERVFIGTLLTTINRGNERIAIFSVPK